MIGVHLAVELVNLRCDRINSLLAGGVRRVHLAVHDGLPPHLHFAGAESGLVQRVRATTTGGLAIFAVETGAERMSMCARPECSRAFASVSTGFKTLTRVQLGAEHPRQVGDSYIDDVVIKAS